LREIGKTRQESAWEREAENVDLPAFPAFWTLEGKRRDRAVWSFERKKRKKKEEARRPPLFLFGTILD
jgi:hypothetical protein